MNLAHAFRHVADSAKEFGPRIAAQDLAYRALNRITSFHVMLGMTAVPLDLNPDLLESRGELRGRFTSRDELIAAAGDEYELTADFIHAAFDKGDDCFAIYDGNRLASFGWYSKKPTKISDELLLHFDPSWVYMYKGFTHPDYRGKRLHGIGMARATVAYANGGSRGLISYVNADNHQSLRSTERMGYRTFGEVVVTRAAGRTLTFATPGCKRYDFRVEVVA